MIKKGTSYIEQRFGQIVKPRKKHLFVKIITISLALVIIILISVGIQCFLEKSFVKDLTTWTSSLPSYWGGIIGGIISGSISFLGVFLTIRYYRNSDLAKSRIAHMPFINIKLIRAESVRLVKSTDDKIIEVPSRFYEIDKNKVVVIDLQLENIGNGFANTLVIHHNNNIGGKSYRKLIKVGDKEKLQLKFYLDDAKHALEISFGLQYVDAMTNEYIQVYNVKCRNDLGFAKLEDIKELISIENGYPEFIGQVHHIGEGN